MKIDAADFSETLVTVYQTVMPLPPRTVIMNLFVIGLLIKLSNRHLESNPVITTSVYMTPRL